MSSYNKKSDVLTPSASSVGFGFFVLFCAILFIVIPKLGGETVLATLFGSDTSHTLINSPKDSYGQLLQSLPNNELVGRAVVFAVWMFVGLIAYTLVTFVAGVFGKIGREAQEMSFMNQDKDSLLHNNLVMVGFKLGVAALWALYMIIYIRYVLSYFVITGFVVFGGGKPIDWLVFGVAGFFLLVATHVQVVFARLMVGRTRIWV